MTLPNPDFFKVQIDKIVDKLKSREPTHSTGKKKPGLSEQDNNGIR